MMRQYELVERVKAYNPGADEALLNRAYVYAMRAHGTQKRASGDPFFAHPLEVAAILTDLRLDDATIVAAVLHDTVEDTGYTLEALTQEFGTEVGHLVDDDDDEGQRRQVERLLLEDGLALLVEAGLHLAGQDLALALRLDEPRVGGCDVAVRLGDRGRGAPDPGRRAGTCAGDSRPKARRSS